MQWGNVKFCKNSVLVRHATFFMFFGGKGCNFFLFCDVFRRITTQKQLFFADLRDCVALGMEVFCVHATFLDFGDNLRCMKQVARLAGAPRNLLICRVILHKPCNLVSKAHSVTGCRLTSCAMQPREQSSPGHGLSRYTTQAMQPRRQSLLGHGLSPYKKTISHCFLRERAPDEAA
ncbi:MAG: hypothetical protein BHW11_03440 [Clostridium sp. CAG:62_40_43]|nr:MAG: hypothetical protein BHW11_03440 [Clostridium sp. CAG:62_40_43]